jgi:hypothetical protein
MVQKYSFSIKPNSCQPIRHKKTGLGREFMFRLKFDRRDFLQTISKAAGAMVLGASTTLPSSPLEAQDKTHVGLKSQVHPAEAPYASIAAGQPWFRSSLVGMEVGPTGAQFGDSDASDTRYCARFNGQEIVRHAVAHSEYLVIWARDGDYAYYNSKLLPKAPGLGARDPLREAVDEARQHKLIILAYCVIQQNGHFLKAHPEWEMRGADGKRIGRFCLNSGYLEIMKQIVAEQLSYDVDGFHIDMLDQGFGPPYGCWCNTCRLQFENQFGHSMPEGATWDAAWDDMLEFRYRTSETFEKEMATYIKFINPHATVDFNYHGSPPFSFEVGQRPVQHAGNGDFVTGETGVWGFSATGVGLNAEFYRASRPGRPYQVAIQRGVRMYHDQTTRPLADIRWELFTLLAHGAFVTMVDKTGFDGSLDPMAYDRVGDAFKEALAKRGNFGQRPVYEVGLYYSSRSRDWIGRENPLIWMQSFLGAQKAMVFEHIPFGVVLDENVGLETLQQFPVVMLPNTAILSEKETALFRLYLQEGGKLLVTGQSGQFDHMGKPLAQSTLSEIIGAKTNGRLKSEDNWVRFSKRLESDSLIAKGLRRDWPFLVEGPATIYSPTTAQPVGELLQPYRTTRQLEGKDQGKEGNSWPMSADAQVGPAILINRVGKGLVFTFAASPDFATASEYHIVEARRLLGNAVRFLHPVPRVYIDAPSNVETVVTDDPANRILRVHCIAYNSTPQSTPVKERPYVVPGLIEDAPIYRIALESNGQVKRAEGLNKSTSVELRGSRIEATVNDIYDVIVIYY